MPKSIWRLTEEEKTDAEHSRLHRRVGLCRAGLRSCRLGLEKTRIARRTSARRPAPDSRRRAARSVGRDRPRRQVAAAGRTDPTGGNRARAWKSSAAASCSRPARSGCAQPAPSTCKLLHRHGGIVETILEREEDARVVVIGKRGASQEFAAGHIGSKIERVVRASNRPVLVASREIEPLAGRRARLRRQPGGAPGARTMRQFSPVRRSRRSCRGRRRRRRQASPPACRGGRGASTAAM